MMSEAERREYMRLVVQLGAARRELRRAQWVLAVCAAIFAILLALSIMGF